MLSFMYGNICIILTSRRSTHQYIGGPLALSVYRTVGLLVVLSIQVNSIRFPCPTLRILHFGSLFSRDLVTAKKILWSGAPNSRKPGWRNKYLPLLATFCDHDHLAASHFYSNRLLVKPFLLSLNATSHFVRWISERIDVSAWPIAGSCCVEKMSRNENAELYSLSWTVEVRRGSYLYLKWWFSYWFLEF